MFINPELIRWDGLCSLYMETLRATPVFNPSTEDGEKRWNDLRNRVVEHVIIQSYLLKYVYLILHYFDGSLFQNIRIISIYYTRIRLSHLSKLLGLGLAEAEDFLCKLVVAGTVRAKTDRPAGIVHFRYEII